MSLQNLSLHRLYALLSLLLLTSLWGCAAPHSVAYPYELPSCETPRKAADTLLYFMQEENYDPQLAATCMEGYPANGPDLARQVKDIFDARGAYVQVPSLPNNADFVNDDGEAVVILHNNVPDIYVSRGGDGQWRYSAYSLRLVPDLHARSFSPLEGLIHRSVPESLTFPVLGLAAWKYLGLLVLILGSAALGRLASALLVRWLDRFTDDDGFKIDMEVVKRTHRPFTFLVMSLVVLWLYADLKLGITLNSILTPLINITLSISVVMLLLTWSRVGENYLAKSVLKQHQQALLPMLNSLGKGLLMAAGLIFVLDRQGFDVSKIWDTLAIGGFAVALASQDTLKNLFGSVTVFVDRPFTVGDWVVVKGVEGTVERIGVRSTRIRTFYGSLVSLPNSSVADAVVDNMGARTHRRFKEVLNLAYDTPPQRIQAFVEGVRAMLMGHQHVRQDYFEVHFYKMSATSLDVLVYCWLTCETWTDELKTRSQLMTAFLQMGEDLGVEFAFPTQTVHLRDMPDQKPMERAHLERPELAALVHDYAVGGARRPAFDARITHGYFAGSAGREDQDDDGA